MERLVLKKIDTLGRINIPKEFMDIQNLKNGDKIELFIEGEFLKIRRASLKKACRVCGSRIRVKEIEKIWLCEKCINKIAEGIEKND